MGVPGAIVSAISAGSGAVGTVAAVAPVIAYGVVGAGAGVAIGTGGSVLAGVATLMSCARDKSLYVSGYPLMPKAISRGLSKLTTFSIDEEDECNVEKIVSYRRSLQGA